MKHQILCWDKDPHEQRTPLLFIGKRVSHVKLEKGAEILGLESRTTYLLDDVVADEEDGKPTGYRKLFLLPVLKDGVHGKRKVASSVNSYLAIRTATISPEHQELFFNNQEVEGEVVDGVFHPHEKYLVNWHKRFSNYFMFMRDRSHDFSNPAKNELPNLLLCIIEEIGPAVFNEFVRHYFVEEKSEDHTMALAHKAMRQVGPIGCDDETKRFAEHMLYIAIRMGNDFWEAVQAIVYKKGVVMDFEERIQ